MKKTACLILALALLLTLAACSGSAPATSAPTAAPVETPAATATAEVIDTALSREETAAFADIAGKELKTEDVTASLLTPERAERFRCVKKIHKTADGNYAFVAFPIGYHGPMQIALLIDGKTNKTIGMRILENIEADEYVRDFDSADWFVGRFAEKDAAAYLEGVELDPDPDKTNQVVTITAATVSTNGIINGVNACFGVYEEGVLGMTAADVDYIPRNSAYEE